MIVVDIYYNHFTRRDSFYLIFNAATLDLSKQDRKEIICRSVYSLIVLFTLINFIGRQAVFT